MTFDLTTASWWIMDKPGFLKLDPLFGFQVVELVSEGAFLGHGSPMDLRSVWMLGSEEVTIHVLD